MSAFQRRLRRIFTDITLESHLKVNLVDAFKCLRSPHETRVLHYSLTVNASYMRTSAKQVVT